MILITLENSNITLEDLNNENYEVSRIYTLTKMIKNNMDIEKYQKEVKDLYKKDLTPLLIETNADKDYVINLHKKNLETYKRDEIKVLTEKERIFYETNQ